MEFDSFALWEHDEYNGYGFEKESDIFATHYVFFFRMVYIDKI